MASVCPMTPPAPRENWDQLVPNWNSRGMPVTTPIAKLIARMRPQKAGGPVVVRIGRPKRRRLEDDDDQGEPHRQLREKVGVGGREGEVDAMGSHGVHDLQRQELWNYLKLQGRSSGDACVASGAVEGGIPWRTQTRPAARVARSRSRSLATRRFRRTATVAPAVAGSARRSTRRACGRCRASR